jgi:hypothetical protein
MRKLLFLGILFLSQPILAKIHYDAHNENIWLVGSTPGDEQIKSKFEIQPNVKVDFIKWDLRLEKSKFFVLMITFGESKPNTLGFINDGQRKVLKGTYSITNNGKHGIYHFKADKMVFSLLKLNENIFHLLNAENELMVGNGGWSYTLNNRKSLKSIGTLYTNSNKEQGERVLQEIYDGRTPCQEFAVEHHWEVSNDCFKLKWKLTLNRDSVTLNPTTFLIRKVVDNVPNDISGIWTINKGTNNNPDATIFLLNSENPNQTISLLVGDNNILYFLRKDNSLFEGNENFSFTLNKRQKALQKD